MITEDKDGVLGAKYMKRRYVQKKSEKSRAQTKLLDGGITVKKSSWITPKMTQADIAEHEIKWTTKSWYAGFFWSVLVQANPYFSNCRKRWSSVSDVICSSFCQNLF